jgi:O-antigen/teichoic acid export membrane protein
LVLSKNKLPPLVRWRNVLWQTVHLGGGGVLYIVIWLCLARFWSIEDFGHFNFLFALIAVGGVFCDFGLDVLLTRIASKKKTLKLQHQRLLFI